MRNLVLIVALLGLVAASGCIGPGITATPTAEELAGNLGAYVGMDVNFNASPMKHTDSVSFTHYINAVSGGKAVRLDMKYEEGIDCNYCNLTGTVMNATICDCQSAKCNGKDCTIPDGSAWEYIDTRLASECEGVSKYLVFGQMQQRSLFRCIPGTVQEKLYVNLTKVETLA